MSQMGQSRKVSSRAIQVRSTPDRRHSAARLHRFRGRSCRDLERGAVGIEHGAHDGLRFVRDDVAHQRDEAWMASITERAGGMEAPRQAVARAGSRPCGGCGARLQPAWSRPVRTSTRYPSPT